MAGSPAVTAPPARAHSSIRWRTRCWCWARSYSLASIGRFAWLPVAIIAVREVAISLYRVYWGRRGLAVPASRGGKLKTLLQGLAVGAAVMPPLAEAHQLVGNALLWASVVVAVVSGLQYLVAGRAAATTMAKAGGIRPEPRPSTDPSR